MTDDLRRKDDQVLSGLSGEVALLRQAQELGAKAIDQRIEASTKAHELSFTAIAKSLETISVKVDQAIDGQTEPERSPAGRALQRQINDHDSQLAEHEARLDAEESFRTEIRTALRTLRVQLTVIGTVVGIVGGMLGIWVATHQVTP